MLVQNMKNFRELALIHEAFIIGGQRPFAAARAILFRPAHQ